jgi:hypothetical protein
MKRRICLVGALVALLSATPARGDNRIIVRSTLSLQALNTACNHLLLARICTVVGGLGDPLGQVFLITGPLDVNGLLNLVGNPLGIIDAELDQLLNLVGGLNILPTPIPATLMSDRTSVPYPAGSTTTAWDGYVNQPAASIVGVQDTQKSFNVIGTGIVADIDTGVDPNHPALQGVLLQGYDFTRNQPGGSELRVLRWHDQNSLTHRSASRHSCWNLHAHDHGNFGQPEPLHNGPSYGELKRTSEAPALFWNSARKIHLSSTATCDWPYGQ